MCCFPLHHIIVEIRNFAKRMIIGSSGMPEEHELDLVTTLRFVNGRRLITIVLKIMFTAHTCPHWTGITLVRLPERKWMTRITT